MKTWNSQMDIESVIKIIGAKQCLICRDSLDHSLKRTDWHIPLCKIHRMEYLDTFMGIKKVKGVRGSPSNP